MPKSRSTTTATVKEHPWLKVLLEHNRAYIAAMFERAKAKIAGKKIEPISLPSHEYYASEVFDSVRPVLSALDRLRWSAALLATFPNAKGYARKGLTRDNWMEYHYAAYAVGYASCRDLALLLTNEVFRLGQPHRLCSMDAVLHNTWVKPTAVPAALRSIAELAKTHQEIRNLHVHRGRTPDLSSLTSGDAFPMLSSVSFVEQIDPGRLSEGELRLVRSLYRTTARELAGNMGVEIEGMDQSLAALFTILQMEYERRYGELRPVDWSAMVAAATANLGTNQS